MTITITDTQAIPFWMNHAQIAFDFLEPYIGRENIISATDLAAISGVPRAYLSTALATAQDEELTGGKLIGSRPGPGGGYYICDGFDEATEFNLRREVRDRRAAMRALTRFNVQLKGVSGRSAAAKAERAKVAEAMENKEGEISRFERTIYVLSNGEMLVGRFGERVAAEMGEVTV